MLLAWWLLPRRPRLARALLGGSILGLYLLSLSPIATALLGSLEDYPPLSPDQTGGAQAIVVLGAGAVDEPEQAGSTPGPTRNTLLRIRQAAYLHKLTGLPVVVCGGGVHNEADAMARSLEQFGVPPDRVIRERLSRNTFQNVVGARDILQERDWHKILVVTQAFHMRRAMRGFRMAGFDPVASPCGLSSVDPFGSGIYAVLPQAEALYLSSAALEEWLANLFYALRYTPTEYRQIHLKG